MVLTRGGEIIPIEEKVAPKHHKGTMIITQVLEKRTLKGRKSGHVLQACIIQQKEKRSPHLKPWKCLLLSKHPNLVESVKINSTSLGYIVVYMYFNKILQRFSVMGLQHSCRVSNPNIIFGQLTSKLLQDLRYGPCWEVPRFQGEWPVSVP